MLMEWTSPCMMDPESMWAAIASGRVILRSVAITQSPVSRHSTAVWLTLAVTLTTNLTDRLSAATILPFRMYRCENLLDGSTSKITPKLLGLRTSLAPLAESWQKDGQAAGIQVDGRRRAQVFLCDIEFEDLGVVNKPHNSVEHVGGSHGSRVGNPNKVVVEGQIVVLNFVVGGVGDFVLEGDVHWEVDVLTLEVGHFGRIDLRDVHSLASNHLLLDVGAGEGGDHRVDAVESDSLDDARQARLQHRHQSPDDDIVDALALNFDDEIVSADEKPGDLEIEADARIFARGLGELERSISLELLHLDHQSALLLQGQSDLELHMTIQSHIDILGHDGEVVGSIHIEHITLPVHIHLLGDVG